MKQIFLLMVLGVIIMSGSCDGNDSDIELTGDINMIFKANYDGEQFYTEQTYEYTPGLPIKFNQFNFFISNVSLFRQVDNDIEENTDLNDIDFIDLSFDTGQTAEAEAGQTVRSKKVPSGRYDGIKISFGLPADLNRTKPADYGSEDVLSRTSHYWDGWSSYIFAKMEGFADLNNNGLFETGAANEGFTYHMGTDETYTTRTIFQDITVSESGTITLNFEVDLKKLFKMTINTYDANDDDFLDIETFRGTHSDAQLEINKTIMNNFSEAISLTN